MENIFVNATMHYKTLHRLRGTVKQRRFFTRPVTPYTVMTARSFLANLQIARLAQFQH